MKVSASTAASPTTASGGIMAKPRPQLPFRVDGDSQTDLVLYPGHDSVADKYSHIHAASYKQLEDLREACAKSMTAVGGTVYDFLAFKDVLLKLEPRLPALPMNDLLMLTSRLYRETGDLAGLLQAFFQNVFSDGYTDDIFGFTDTRLLKKEVVELREERIRLQRERDEAVQKYSELSQGLHKHAIVVKALEDRNDALELRSSALEDQMALLFSQLADDFVFYNEELLEKAHDRLSVQQALVPARSTFSQSVDTINKRLVTFQGTLNEIYNDAKINAISNERESSGSSSSVKSKLKQLDQHVQQIIQRFSAVKDGLLATSEELVAALKDKKRIINFSLQHIKLFDIQSAKLRASRALMHEIRQRVTTLERTMAQSLINGTLITIDRNGEIMSGSDSQGRGTDGIGGKLVIYQQTSQQRHAVSNVKIFQAQLLELQDAVQKVTAALDTTAEQKTMLKTISLAIPSTGRSYGQKPNQSSGKRAKDTANPVTQAIANATLKNTPADAAQLLTSLRSQLSRASHQQPLGGMLTLNGDNNNSYDNDSFSGLYQNNNSFDSAPARDKTLKEKHVGFSPSTTAMVMMRQLKSDFVSKLDFLRSVYEGQISNYEERIDELNQVVKQLQSRLNSSANQIRANGVGEIESTSSALSVGLSSTAQKPNPTDARQVNANPSALIRLFGMTPASEGGAKAIVTSPRSFLKVSSDQQRLTEESETKLISSYFYLLREGEVCAWHRSTSTNNPSAESSEIWCWHGGSPIQLFVAREDPKNDAIDAIKGVSRFILGGNLMEGHVPQVIIEKGAWLMAELCDTRRVGENASVNHLTLKYALLSRIFSAGPRTTVPNVALLSDAVDKMPPDVREKIPMIFDITKASDLNVFVSKGEHSLSNYTQPVRTKASRPPTDEDTVLASRRQWVDTRRDILTGAENMYLYDSQAQTLSGARQSISAMISAAQRPAATFIASSGGISPTHRIRPGIMTETESYPRPPSSRVNEWRDVRTPTEDSSPLEDDIPALMTRARGATHAPESFSPKSSPLRQ